MPVRCLIDISQSFSRRYWPILPVIEKREAEACSMSFSTPDRRSSAISGLLRKERSTCFWRSSSCSRSDFRSARLETSRISNSVSSAMWWSCGSLRAMKWRERSNRSSRRRSVRMRSFSGYS
jgi:hypothetical protein